MSYDDCQTSLLFLWRHFRQLDILVDTISSMKYPLIWRFEIT